MPLIHINTPRGHYIGQVRPYGRRRWTTVTGRHTRPERALAQAVLHMYTGNNIKRARVLFVDHSGYYAPHICMEASR